MQLKDVLTLSRVEIDPPISAKKRLLEMVANACAPESCEHDFFDALIEREKLGSTALGHGVALPHARVNHIDAPVAVFIRLKDPIPYDNHDDAAVDLIFGLFVPHNEESAHLGLLSAVANCLNQSNNRDAIRQAHTAQDIWNILTHEP
jgi:PTS system nitrogen regulatory IIA component